MLGKIGFMKSIGLINRSNALSLSLSSNARLFRRVMDNGIVVVVVWLMKTNEKRDFAKKCVRLINLVRARRNETVAASTGHWILSIVFPLLQQLRRSICSGCEECAIRRDETTAFYGRYCDDMLLYEYMLISCEENIARLRTIYLTES